MPVRHEMELELRVTVALLDSDAAGRLGQVLDQHDPVDLARDLPTRERLPEHSLEMITDSLAKRSRNGRGALEGTPASRR